MDNDHYDDDIIGRHKKILGDVGIAPSISDIGKTPPL